MARAARVPPGTRTAMPQDVVGRGLLPSYRCAQPDGQSAHWHPVSIAHSGTAIRRGPVTGIAPLGGEPSAKRWRGGSSRARTAAGASFCSATLRCIAACSPPYPSRTSTAPSMIPRSIRASSLATVGSGSTGPEGSVQWRITFLARPVSRDVRASPRTAPPAEPAWGTGPRPPSRRSCSGTGQCGPSPRAAARNGSEGSFWVPSSPCPNAERPLASPSTCRKRPTVRGRFRTFRNASSPRHAAASGSENSPWVGVGDAHRPVPPTPQSSHPLAELRVSPTL